MSPVGRKFLHTQCFRMALSPEGVSGRLLPPSSAQGAFCLLPDNIPVTVKGRSLMGTIPRTSFTTKHCKTNRQTNNKQTNKKTHFKIESIDTSNRMVVTRRDRGWREDKEGKGGQTYGNKRKLDFGWGTHN